MLWGLTNRGRLLYLQHPSARVNDWLAYSHTGSHTSHTTRRTRHCPGRPPVRSWDSECNPSWSLGAAIRLRTYEEGSWRYSARWKGRLTNSPNTRISFRRKSTEHELRRLSSPSPEGNVRTCCFLIGTERLAEMTLVLAAAVRNTNAAVWSSNLRSTVFGHNNETHPTN